jgi:hypothetical protein
MTLPRPWKSCFTLISSGSLLFLTFLWAREPLWARTRIDPEKVYCGDVHKYSRPAVVDGDKVYRQIPAYQEILERGLTRRDPDYWPLLRKASQLFVKALRQICREKGYDLVGEVHSISSDSQEIPEITADLIRLVEKGVEEASRPPASTPAS